MTLATESVAQSGNGLVFINTYDASVTPAYRDAVIAAEHEFQAHFTNQVTVNLTFQFSPLDVDKAVAENFPAGIRVSYGAFSAALRAAASSSDDLLAVNGLPAADPSNGAGFLLAHAQARILGLAHQTEFTDDVVVLNSNLGWSFGQDAIGAIEHEISEGVFGRLSSLGLTGSPRWSPLDLFRFTATGERDYTGGSDGVTTYFGVDAGHVTLYAYHGSLNGQGQFDGQDLGDWAYTRGDAFGPGGPIAPGSLSSTDLTVLDVLGWNSARFVPHADDFANSLGDSSHPMGEVTLGVWSFGVLEQAGDRDWFQVQLQAGQTYVFGQAPASGDLLLGGPLLRLHDASGALLVTDTAVLDQLGVSELVYTPSVSGTYYVEAGGAYDGYAGSYALGIGQSGTAATDGDDYLVAKAGGDSLSGGQGDDTMAAAGGLNTLFGGDGADWIFGGSGHSNVNGNKGDDIIVGQSAVGDWLLGGQGDDVIDAARSTGHNIINGNLGDDIVIGGSGGDTLRGGQGADDIRGGSGNDWISGDLGRDSLWGGAGADTFHAGAGVDTVWDFDAGEGDRVQVDAGLTYTTSQSGSDVLISLSNGGRMTLHEVQLSSLPSGWIFQS